mmetsp:Transcript_28787/g.43949  ORF Transcript_28787/g.43949 Transcript_28787/m.43949 type:complete len:384 (+) Transcript_28787:42-1193(+)
MAPRQHDVPNERSVSSSIDQQVDDSTPLSSASKLHHNDGYPPWHAIALIIGFVAIFVQQLLASPSSSSNDNHSLLFSRALFPNMLPLSVVVSIRLGFALIIFCDIFRALFLAVYLDHRSDYYPGSQLKASAPILYRGILTKDGTIWSGFLCVASFTEITWMLEGVFFFLAGILPLLSKHDSNSSSIVVTKLSSLALMLWEIVTPCAFLVTLIVTFVLWPFAIEAKKQGNPGQIGLLNSPGPLLAHNLNVMAITMELSLLGGLPLRRDHFAMAPLYGCAYVLFSWSMRNSWLPQLSATERKSWGAQFIYPFMDTTLGWNTSFSLLALLMVLLASHWGVYGLHQLLHFYGPRLSGAIVEDDDDVRRFAAHCSVMFVIGVCICRFR